ncbi:MAG: 2-hydroxyacyl-CoA dehydratase family protein, partial [Actinobacteria bacterium]|nr:2-hydroxyacyl-CoA dehydratase family protein [Actinomycetota bacterium]
RRRDPGVLPSDKALMVVAASALMDKEEHNALLEELLGNIEARVSSGGPPPQSSPLCKGEEEGEEEGEKVRLFGIGSVMDQWEFLAMVEDVGGTVIDDDFCTGYRYAGAMAPEHIDPIESIARRIWEGAPCPCKHVTTRDRAELLLERITGSGSEGVLFFQFKFCEPHAFDYPYVKKALDERGIPSLHLEIEQGSVSIPRLRTRVEALLETIRRS